MMLKSLERKVHFWKEEEREKDKAKLEEKVRNGEIREVQPR